ncbi:MAG: restriction endonuclease subunit S, partial [Desulfobacteraceae bacterium]
MASKSHWTDCTLGDVITLKRGYDLPNRDRIDGEYPVVSSSGITGTHSVAKARGPGVVTGRYGTLGQVFYVPGDFWPLNTSLYVEDFKGNHPRFISFLLQTLNFGKRSGAAAVPGVNRNDLHMLRIKKPNLPTQYKIAAVLSTYDDLIENNLRRIKILEEMAQNLYREWFVKFRFPGHQHARFVDSLLGRIPEGWRWAKLKDVCDSISYGFTASANKEVVGPKFLRITDIVPNTIEW